MAELVFTTGMHREDLYIAECPEVGTVSHGKTSEEAAANLKEATALDLEESPLPGSTRPVPAKWQGLG